jgi:hypothetical protein
MNIRRRHGVLERIVGNGYQKPVETQKFASIEAQGKMAVMRRIEGPAEYCQTHDVAPLTFLEIVEHFFVQALDLVLVVWETLLIFLNCLAGFIPLLSFDSNIDFA